MAHSLLVNSLEEKSDAMWELPYRGVYRWYTEVSGQELGPKTIWWTKKRVPQTSQALRKLQPGQHLDCNFQRFSETALRNCELTNFCDFKPLNLQLSSYAAIHNKSCVLQTKTALRIRERWKAGRSQIMWIGSMEKVWQQGRHFKWRVDFLPASHPSPKFSLQENCC